MVGKHSKEWKLLEVLCTVYTKICWWVISAYRKAFSATHCYANDRQYLCERAKKEYHLTEVIKCELFLDSLSLDAIINYMNSARQQLFKSKK